jgi:hypothetical protein
MRTASVGASPCASARRLCSNVRRLANRVCRAAYRQHRSMNQLHRRAQRQFHTHTRVHTQSEIHTPSLVVQSCAAPLSPTPTIHVHSRRYIAEPDTWAPPPRSPRLACVIPQPSRRHAGQHAGAVAEQRDNAVSLPAHWVCCLCVAGGCPVAPTAVAIKRSAPVLVGDLPAAVAS